MWAEVTKPSEVLDHGTEILRLGGAFEMCIPGWRDGSVGCFSRGPRFKVQHPHRSSQLPVTLVLGHLALSLASSDTRHSHGVHTYLQTKYPCTKINKILKKNKIHIPRADTHIRTFGL